MENAMTSYNTKAGFGVEKRTVRALSPCDTQLVSGGSAAGWFITGVIVGVTIMSSIECTPADGEIAETLA